MVRAPPLPCWNTGSEISPVGIEIFSPRSMSVMERRFTASSTERLMCLR